MFMFYSTRYLILLLLSYMCGPDLMGGSTSMIQVLPGHLDDTEPISGKPMHLKYEPCCKVSILCWSHIVELCSVGRNVNINTTYMTFLMN